VYLVTCYIPASEWPGLGCGEGTSLPITHWRQDSGADADSTATQSHSLFLIPVATRGSEKMVAEETYQQAGLVPKRPYLESVITLGIGMVVQYHSRMTYIQLAMY
jgi:hypothetical protein